MAELLIKARDYLPADPAQEPWAFKRGMLVAVMPDGHDWGSEERNTSKFYIVRFPGLSVEEFARYMEPEYAEPVRPMMRFGVMRAAEVDAGDEPLPEPPAPLLRVRAWHATGTPTELQAALEAGPLEASWEELKVYVRRIADGATPDEV